MFTRFDEGIQPDKESWYSVTPEAIANHIAAHLVEGKENVTMLDLFFKCGGNAIALALRKEVSLVVCVVTNLEKLKKAAPPWGGMDYVKVGKRNYDLTCIKVEGIDTNPVDGDQLLDLSANAVGHKLVALFLLRNGGPKIPKIKVSNSKVSNSKVSNSKVSNSKVSNSKVGNSKVSNSLLAFHRRESNC
jgi:hypothetical protein